MLKQCPECNLQVSDKAFYCPHCGYPFEQNIKPARRSTKKKRLPNGFGQITELKQNLRKPFRAMITQGFTEEGKPIQKLLKPVSYFETYNEAYEALLRYNRNPFLFESNITVEELFWKWYDHYANTINPKTAGYIRPAWNRCKPIWNIKLHSLRKIHIKTLINDCDTTITNKNFMKRLLALMLDYAVDCEVIEKNVAADIKIEDTVKKENIKIHNTLSDEDLAVLWQNINLDPCVKYILIQCYMGWRPAELLSIKKDDVNINEWYIVGGMKTKNGKNRKVPVHSCIRNIIKDLYENSTIDYLITNKVAGKERPFSYIIYQQHFNKVLSELNISEHLPHDSRVTFVTLCKKYKVDEYAIKYMVGHSIKDLTEETYTRREFSWLQDEIEKIKASV